MYKILLPIALTACLGSEIKSNVPKTLEEKKVVISVLLKPFKNLALNYTNDFFTPKTLLFGNKSDKDTVILKSVSITQKTLFSFLSAFYITQTKTFKRFDHEFYLYPGVDSLFLGVTDSSDIYIQRSSGGSVQFQDQYTQFPESSLESPLQKIENIHPEKTLAQNEAIFNSNKNKIDAGFQSGKITENIQQELLQHNKLNYFFTSLVPAARHIGNNKSMEKTYTPVLNEIIKASIHFLVLQKGYTDPEISQLLDLDSVYNKSALFYAHIVSRLVEYPEKKSPPFNKTLESLKTTYYYSANKAALDSIFGNFSLKTDINTLRNFSLIDRKGNKLTMKQVLDQNIGKTIFVDFWASWCAPCKAEMKILRQLRKKITTPSIVFLCISLDEDDKINAWLSSEKAEGIDPAYSYKSAGGFVNDFLKLYEVSNIPRYMIINSAGELVNENFERPSDPNFVKKLMKLQANP
jgi:thiol-disulfide isomerase/thioredoxin